MKNESSYKHNYNKMHLIEKKIMLCLQFSSDIAQVFLFYGEYNLA